jgi:two-component system, LytTR family, response regulator
MNIVIVDDSRLARKELAGLLSEQSRYDIVGEAADVQSALEIINQLKPDLLLLDIHLPDGSGFDVLEQAEHIPKVIFTTAYEQHALRAFEVNALDYLLKPITSERLFQALEKIDTDKILPNTQTQATTNRKADDHLFIREGERCHFVKYHEIRLLQVDGNYVRLFFRNTNAMMPRSLNYVEERLDPTVFFRANRQQIVNLNFVDRMEPWIGDGLLIIMKDGSQVEASRRQARELKNALEM